MSDFIVGYAFSSATQNCPFCGSMQISKSSSFADDAVSYVQYPCGLRLGYLEKYDLWGTLDTVCVFSDYNSDLKQPIIIKDN